MQGKWGVEVASLSIELSCDVTCPQFEKQTHLVIYLPTFLAAVFTQSYQRHLLFAMSVQL